MRACFLHTGRALQTDEEAAVRAAIPLLVLAMIGPAEAGKLYRCADGSYEDKPCMGGKVVGSNRPAPRAEGDKACVETGKRAEQMAQARVDGVALEDVLADIDGTGESYERRLGQKKLAVQVYQSRSSPVEARVVAEADCVAAKSQAAPAARAEPIAPAAPAVPADGAAERAAADARRRAEADAARQRQCSEYRSQLSEVRARQRSQTSVQESDRLNAKRRELDRQIWEICG